MLPNCVSVGEVCRRPCVLLTEAGVQHPLRFFVTTADANSFATSESIRLGLGPMYRGTPTL